MKTKLLVAAGLSIALIVWITTQLGNYKPAPEPGPKPDPRPPIEGAPMGTVGIDPITHQIVPLPGAAPMGEATLAGYNELVQIEERGKVHLLANNPEQYFKKFPKSKEALEAEEKAKLEMVNPISYSEKLRKQKDPERIKEMNRSLEEILNPVAYHAKLKKDQITKGGPEQQPKEKSKQP